MAAMRMAGPGHGLPAHANVREDAHEYVVQLDVSDFTEAELEVETIGQRVTLRGAQREAAADAEEAFRLHERLEESFRLPDDADAGAITAFYVHGTLELRVPRLWLEPRTVPIEHEPLRVHPDAVPC
ncbi:MAG TPA: Hsp20/alpha crystallin family protein [Gaiellaceae bacterium]|nr:Hsp20/alpha crystallin family protein [Gaiellaceae bacterium]